MVTVTIRQRDYRMPEEKALQLLKEASEKVPCGVYGLKRGNDYEIRNDPMTRTQMKELRRMARQQGVKVFCNGL